MSVPRWKQIYRVCLPALASCGGMSFALGVIYDDWWSVWLGAFCLGGLVRGLVDPQIRGRS